MKEAIFIVQSRYDKGVNLEFSGMLCQAISDGANPMQLKVCYLTQYRHLRCHAELTVKRHSNVASDGSRLGDAVTDDDISQTVLASRAHCNDHKHFSLIVI